MSFFAELKRRNVIRVGIAYAAVSWLLAQVAELAFGAFGAPNWALRALLIALLIGFPITLVIAWIYEFTPEGVRVDTDGVSDGPVGLERKFDRIVIGVLAAAITVLLVERFYISQTIFTGEAQSVAVLPFVNISDDSDHFADGLSEELLNVLARNPKLRVAGRTSSFAFKGQLDDLREIGDALDVEHLLEGSVRRSGRQLRITAQLIQVDDGFHVWSRTYDRQLADIFEIQDDVARKIADALEVRLIPDSNRPTDDVEAYALYLEALAMSDFPDGEIGEAIELLDRALELDPTFARAHLLKAMAYWQAAGWTMDQVLARPLVYRSSAAALDLDPTLLTARPFILSATPAGFSWLENVEALEAAISFEPNNYRLLDTIANSYLLTGYYEESLNYSMQMVEQEPLSPLSYHRVAYALSAMGRRTEARDYWKRGDEYGGINGIWRISWDHLAAGEIEESISAKEEYFRLAGWDVAEVRPMMEGALDSDTGKAFLDDWLRAESAALAAQGLVSESWQVYTWYVFLGYFDDAFAIIDEEVAQNESAWLNTVQLRFNGVVYPLTGFRSDPRFVTEELVELWDARGKPDACDKIDGEWTCQ